MGGPGVDPGPLPPGQRRGALVAEVARVLGALPRGARAVVAVSGGPDSLALAHLAAEARPDLGLTLAHVRHGLRPDHADVAMVRRHGRVLGLSPVVVDVTVGRSGRGWEADARDQRHAALRRVARDVGAGWILLGHTADDQAETLLLRIARGTGLRGLAGMAATRGDQVRPLLRVRRADLLAFLAGEGFEHVEDPSNADPAFRRNRTRHEVVPVLRALAADPVGALARLADLARDDAAHLDAEAADAADGLLVRHGPVVACDVAALHALDASLARRVVRQAVDAVRAGDEPPTSAQVARVLAMSPGTVTHLPGVVVSSGGGRVAFGPDPPQVAAEVDLVVPGATRWAPTGVRVVASDASSRVDEPPSGQLSLDLGQWTPPRVDVAPGAVPVGGRAALCQVVLPASVTSAGRLVLRPRRDGDRIATRAGTRKLQDVMVDAGVPRVLRPLLAVLDVDGVVAWVPGLAIDAALAAEGARRPALHLVVRAG